MQKTEKNTVSEDKKNKDVFHLDSAPASVSGEEGPVEPMSPDENVVDLFDQFRRALKLFVLVTVKCENTAEDIAQESYLRFLRVQSEKVITHPRAYLFRTAKNLSTDFLRRRALNVIDRKTEVNEEIIEGSEASPEESLILAQTKSELEKVLASMPRKARQVFYYRRYDGLSIKDISSRMNISERMVFKYMRTAMQSLAVGLKRESK